jgi:hypothetical protein
MIAWDLNMHITLSSASSIELSLHSLPRLEGAAVGGEL